MNFNKVIIWGHKHSHTHTHVHEAFYRAFSFIGYDTLWLDNNDDISNLALDNCLFLTEGQVDQNIPLNKTSKYITHNCDSKYLDYDSISIQVYTNDVLKYDLNKINHYTFVSKDGKGIIQPWATDLLPNEIRFEKINFKISSDINWIGSYNGGTFGNENEINPLIDAAKNDGKNFNVYGGFSKNILDRNEHIKMIRQSFIAPAIVGTWQLEKGYIPCRIFKNISYGHMGVTNSKKVNEVFDNLLIYNEDTNQLYTDYINQIDTLEERIKDLINIVKTEHTYINRINNILKCL